jgi:hypothetical protein
MVLGFIIIVGLVSCSTMILTETTSINQNVKNDVKINYVKELGRKQV